MKTTNIALVGVGGWSRYHYDRIKELELLGEVKLGAVMIRAESMERYRGLAETLRAEGVRVYTEYEAMLSRERGRVELVVIPTGINNHCKMSVGALDAGYHVLCEKPVAGTVDECSRMKVAQKRSGRILAICFQNIYSPTIQQMKRYALGGQLGALRSAKTCVLWPRANSYYARAAWGGKLVFEGETINDCPLMNATAHFLNIMLYLSGDSSDGSAEPAAIYGENYRVKPIESCDTQFLRVHTNTGVKLLFMTSHSTDVRVDPFSEYVFERGKITWSFNGEAVVYKKTGGTYTEVERLHSGGDEFMKPVYMNVCEAIRNGTQPLADINNSCQHVMCVEKTFQSGPIIDVPEEFIGSTQVLKDDDCLKSGDTNLFIKGIKPLVQKMYDEELSFYEAGCPWAVKSRTVIVEDRKPHRERSAAVLAVA